MELSVSRPALETFKLLSLQGTRQYLITPFNHGRRIDNEPCLDEGIVKDLFRHVFGKVVIRFPQGGKLFDQRVMRIDFQIFIAEFYGFLARSMQNTFHGTGHITVGIDDDCRAIHQPF